MRLLTSVPLSILPRSGLINTSMAEEIANANRFKAGRKKSGEPRNLFMRPLAGGVTKLPEPKG
jgi:hypothetical protein